MTAPPQTKLRLLLRYLHIALGLVLMCYVYSPFHRNFSFQIVVKFLVIPFLTISGLGLWKIGFFAKILKFPFKK